MSSTEKIIALYDLMGIQKFIFASNRLKENIGASNMVAMIFDKFLVEIIKYHFGPSNVITNMASSGCKASDNWIDKDAVIISTRAGKALVLYKDLKSGREVTKELSKRVLAESGGKLSFIVHYAELTGSSFFSIYGRLIKELEEKKQFFFHTRPLSGIAITKLETRTNLPVQESEKDQYYSLITRRKLFRAEKEIKSFSELLENKAYTFPNDLDKLIIKGSQFSYMAVVHVDGDRMGRLIKEHMENDEKDQVSLEQAIYNYSTFSEELACAYRNALKKTVTGLANAVEKNKLSFTLPNSEGSTSETFIPFRPLILNGDDVTYITHGKIGLSFTKKYLENLSKEKIKYGNTEIKHTASAGVLITKIKFPFSQAYGLVNDLTRSAKLKGLIVQEMNEKQERGFWVDFHVLQTNSTENLERIREKQYDLAGKEKARPLKLQDLEMKQYNLLWRPWVVGKSGSDYSIHHLIKLINEFSNQKAWPRSKLKDLQNSFGHSLRQLRESISFLKFRGLELPQFTGLGNLSDPFKTKDYTTPYYDALEMINYYEDY